MVKDLIFRSEHVALFSPNLSDILNRNVGCGFLRTNQKKNSDKNNSDENNTYIAYCQCQKFKISDVSNKRERYNFKKHNLTHFHNPLLIETPVASTPANTDDCVPSVSENTEDFVESNPPSIINHKKRSRSFGNSNRIDDEEEINEQFEAMSLTNKNLEKKITALQKIVNSQDFKITPYKEQIKDLQQQNNEYSKLIDSFSKKSSKSENLPLEKQALWERNELSLRMIRSRLEGKHMSWLGQWRRLVTIES